MIEIQIFENEMFGAIRTVVMNDGQIWFVGKDVAEALGYAIPTKAIQDHVDISDINVLKYKAFSKTEKASILWKGNDYSDKVIINESGLYALILGSKLSQAQDFKHWVTSVVLPQIRRTGGYIPVSDDETAEQVAQRTIEILKRTLAERDRRLAEQRETINEQIHLIAQQRHQLRLQQPRVEFANALAASPDSILLRDLAKLITQNGYRIGQNRLFRWMRSHGYIFQNDTRPIQHWVEQGIFDTCVSVIKSNHATHSRLATRVTPKGQRYFLRLFANSVNNGV